MEPLVALLRRYCVDYTNSHDLSVCDEIMRPDYVVHISGHDLVRDATYKPAVRGVLARFPGLGLTVHELMTDGERLAMRFSEHGVAADADPPRAAAWGGIGLYRWDGERLTENFVQQDFAGQARQLETGRPDPLEPPHLDPWQSTVAQPGDPAAVAAVREWLGAGDLYDAREVVLDGSWHAGLEPPLLEVSDVAIDVVFGAGDRVAFHVRQTGPYRGGLPGTGPGHIGRETTLRCVGIARVVAGEVAAVRAITDRFGARAALGAEVAA